MIDFVLAELKRQGVVITDQVGSATKVAACQTYGGERVYVPKLPKLQSAARIARATQAGAHTNAQIVEATGLSIRHVKSLRRR